MPSFLDQSPIGRSARSNPVTYLKAFDEIRKTFAATHEAKLRNYDAGQFSFNVEGGRCNACQGRRLPDDRHAIPARRDGALPRVPRAPAIAPRPWRSPTGAGTSPRCST